MRDHRCLTKIKHYFAASRRKSVEVGKVNCMGSGIFEQNILGSRLEVAQVVVVFTERHCQRGKVTNTNFDEYFDPL